MVGLQRLMVTHGKLSRVLASGALSGLAICLLPFVGFALNALFGYANILMYGSKRYIYGTDDILRKNLGYGLSYMEKGWTFIAAMVAAGFIMAAMNRFFLKKGRYFTIPMEGKEIVFGWDMPIVLLAVPIVLAAALPPEVSGVLFHAQGLILFTGAALYALWEIPYWALLGRMGAIDRHALTAHRVDEVLKLNNWLGSCKIDVKLDDDNIAHLTGTVSDRDQFSSARDCVLTVVGVAGVDTSGLRVVKRRI